MTQIDPESPVMVIGDKSKAQLSCAALNNLCSAFNQIADAVGVADLIVKSCVQYDSIVLVYNKFMSAISYIQVCHYGSQRRGGP
jgi:F-type H+-transporting ATPase subunit gamma